MQRRERRRSDRKDAMLDAALALVLEDGLDALTIAKLAGRMEMAVGAMYRYFPGKSALVAALQAREVLSLAADLRLASETAVSAAPELSPGDRAIVRAFAATRGYLRQSVEAPHRHRLIDASLSATEQLLDPDAARSVADVLGRLLEVVSTPLIEAARLGALTEGDALARTHILWAAVHGFDHLRKQDRNQPRRLRAAALVEIATIDLMRGWGATPTTIENVVGALRRT
ncbi:MAG: TetR/AcrR family transcriptional regulator [Myxococcales bacterium]|nr:TetR/AcrR family transcriptional regulator [Myxococcales bacterium]